MKLKLLLSYNRQVKKTLKTFLPGLFFILLVFAGCKKEASVKSETELNESVENALSTTEKTETEETSKAIWYEFSGYTPASSVSLKRISKPVASDSFLPWTEAVSVNSVGLMYSPAILLVNRVGVIGFSDLDLNEPKLAPFDFLSDRTVDGFYSSSDGTLLRVYRNSVFSSEPILTSERQAFLCRYNPISEEVVPLYFPENFALPKHAQCTHLEKIAGLWYVSFKIETGNQVNFAFFKFKSIDKIASAKYSEITKEEFQNALRPVVVEAGTVYSNSVLSVISTSFNEFFESSKIGKINLIVSSSTGLDCKKRVIVKNPNATADSKEVDATALLDVDSYDLITLTETGVLFFFKDDDENSSNIMKNLPELPDGFVYSYFVVSKDRVVATWNEQTFFEIGKSGILSFMLD